MVLVMDIHGVWATIQNENAGRIMGFTTELVRDYWRMIEDEDDCFDVPPNKIEVLNAYRKEAMSGDYYGLKCASAEFILEHTGIDLRVS